MKKGGIYLWSDYGGGFKKHDFCHPFAHAGGIGTEKRNPALFRQIITLAPFYLIR